MSEMQLNQLPTIPQTPSDDAVLAIEVNGITYKVSKEALAAAIANNIDPDDIGALPDTATPADIGALPDTTTPSDIGALPNTTTPADIGAPKSLSITTDDTLASIIGKLNEFGSNEQGIFSCANGTVASLLTAGKVTGSYRGVIARLNATSFDLFGSVGSGGTMAAGRITVSSNAISVTNFSSYTGTTIN